MACTGEICRFAEVVVWRHSFPEDRRLRRGLRYQKADPAWGRGLWLGRASDTDEYLIGTQAGVELSRSLRRLPEAEQADV